MVGGSARSAPGEAARELAAVAVYLVIESYALLLGESADAATVRAILEVAYDKSYIASARPPLTVHFGPHEVLVNIDVRFRRGLSAAELAHAITDFETSVRKRCPQVRRMYIEAKSFDGDSG